MPPTVIGKSLEERIGKKDVREKGKKKIKKRNSESNSKKPIKSRHTRNR